MAEQLITPLQDLAARPQERLTPQQAVDALCQDLVRDAVARDRVGGVPLAARQWIRDTGLLGLSVPTPWGGTGWSWSAISPLVRQVARVDSSVAHLLSYHYLGLTIPLIFGDAAGAEALLRRTASKQLFWCNALNPRDRRSHLRAEGPAYRLDGLKSFCSGSHDSDVIPTTAVLESTGELVIVILPTRTPGVDLLDDWDAIGQRQTSSGTVRFEQVAVQPEQIFYPSRQGSSAFSSARTLLAQLNLANIYLGLAEGALQAAVDQVRERQAAAPDQPKDPTQAVLARDRFAQLWVQLQGASAHYELALTELETAWQQGRALTAEQRGSTAITIATTKVLATEVALAISSAIFDRLGARSTGASHGLDRYWRNIRTLSLHDPVEAKLQEIGAFVIEGSAPTPGFYS
ncbi:acyl-CoA dehydrogenase family protein [Vulcanococcus limneticus]|uniref:acyl-CoA dehydrogenase family protein n=1 Tax=Vulcanococcus limneticus TaxID=2170428 RepID=UPI00398BD8FC